MDSSKTSQLGFSWPQWIRKKANESGDFGDLCLSPPSDDGDSFLHWSCLTNRINKENNMEGNNDNQIMESKGFQPMSVEISPLLSTNQTSAVTTNQMTALSRAKSTGNLVEKVKEFAPGIKPSASVSPSPLCTPVPSPQPSPNITKKKYVPSPYFTERENDVTKSWLFRSIKKPEGETRDESSALSTLKSMQPNELREMNLFCPLSM